MGVAACCVNVTCSGCAKTTWQVHGAGRDDAKQTSHTVQAQFSGNCTYDHVLKYVMNSTSPEVQYVNRKLMHSKGDREYSTEAGR